MPNAAARSLGSLVVLVNPTKGLSAKETNSFRLRDLGGSPRNASMSWMSTSVHWVFAPVGEQEAGEVAQDGRRCLDGVVAAGGRVPARRARSRARNIDSAKSARIGAAAASAGIGFGVENLVLYRSLRKGRAFRHR
jgi:hypothetical protein